MIQLFSVYARWMASRKRSASTTNSLQPLVKATFLFYVLNLIVHSLHYMDNIYRPIAYCEPKWLYDKYLLSTMEITFFGELKRQFYGVSDETSYADSKLWTFKCTHEESPVIVRHTIVRSVDYLPRDGREQPVQFKFKTLLRSPETFFVARSRRSYDDSCLCFEVFHCKVFRLRPPKAVKPGLATRQL